MNCCRFKNRRIKQYTTLELLCEYEDADGAPLPLNGIDIRAQARDVRGALIDELDSEILEADGGVFVLKQTVSKLPAGTLKIDILMSRDSKRIQSDTIEIEVEQSITEPGASDE